MPADQSRAVVELARALARTIERHDSHLALIEGCQRCVRAEAPDDFVRVAVAVVASHLGAVEVRQYLPGKLGELLETCTAVVDGNIAAVEKLRGALHNRVGEGAEAPVLLGDGAALLGLYGTLSAFRATVLEAAATKRVGLEILGQLAPVLRSAPDEVATAFVPGLVTALPGALRPIRAGEMVWQVPTGELLALLLAARLGDPEAAPLPLQWFHLAVQLLTLRDLDPGRLVMAAEALGVGGATCRGLATMTRIIPELTVQVPLAQLDLSRWETLLAMPVPSRKVVRESLKIVPK